MIPENKKEKIEQDLKEGREKFNEGFKELRNIGRLFFDVVGDVTEDFIGEATTQKAKDTVKKATDTVKDTVSDVTGNFNNIKDKLETEELLPNVTDEAYTSEVCLAGAPKESLSLSLENEKLKLVIDTTNIPKEYRKNWNIKKSKLQLSLDNVQDADIKNIKSSYTNGIFTIVVPRVQKEEDEDTNTTNINID